MANGQRIDELRRRVDLDPASILFAQLAEEHRRAGHFEEAARICRAGLARHPDYLAARVTLGRALIELGQLDEAQRELEQVLHIAPDNLAARRSLTEVRRRRDVPSPEPRVPNPELRTPSPEPRPSTSARDARSEVEGRVPSLESDRNNRALAELERWLEAIVADRAARRRGQAATR